MFRRWKQWNDLRSLRYNVTRVKWVPKVGRVVNFLNRVLKWLSIRTGNGDVGASDFFAVVFGDRSFLKKHGLEASFRESTAVFDQLRAKLMEHESTIKTMKRREQKQSDLSVRLESTESRLNEAMAMLDEIGSVIDNSRVKGGE